jgi:DNA-binding MltR family transcriptional regulator
VPEAVEVREKLNHDEKVYSFTHFGPVPFFRLSGGVDRGKLGRR